MAASKLNTFHWHITDSHSFPYVSKSQPDLSKYGAYSADKIYTPEDVQDIIEFATVRYFFILVEFTQNLLIPGKGEYEFCLNLTHPLTWVKAGNTPA